MGIATPPGGSGIPGVDAPQGTGDPGGSGSGGGLGGSGSGSGSGVGSNGCLNGTTAANVGNGHHNAGTDCMDGCHNHGFTLAGTLYTSSAGTTIIAGGTITIRDAAGHTFDVVSQRNGNFYTSTAVTFPVTVIASECPAAATMTESIASGSGGCNRTGCHTTGGQGRIHLP